MKSKIRYILLVGFCLVRCMVVFAQALNVSGTVKDLNNGQPLAGVNIIVQGTDISSVTDANGYYKIAVPNSKSVLLFSYVGYITETITSGDRTAVDIVMIPGVSLETVVVVGYGTQKKRDVTGAISSISSKDLSETPVSNVLEMAQGRMAGVDIVKSDGSPGAGLQIRIRGNRSINASNEPLFVVDGIPASGNVNSINPDDIESLEVLKDASAVAIYGSRGANGVVLITTKKGKDGKAVIGYNGYYGVKEPVEKLNFMNGTQFAEYLRISRGLSPTDNSQDATFLSTVEMQNLKDGKTTNWTDLILQRGDQQEHNLSASGGSERINYYLSGSYYNETGIVQLTDFNRYSFRANIQAKLTDKLSIGASSTVSTSRRNQMADAPFARSTKLSPLVSPFNDSGKLLDLPMPQELSLINPLLYFEPDQFVDETKSYKVFASLFAKYDITKNLSYRLNYGPDYSSTRRGGYSGSFAGSLNSASVSNQLDFDYTLENILSYDNSFGEHNLSAIALFSTQKSRSELSSVSGIDIPIGSSSFYGIGSASTVSDIESSLGEWGLLSYMGRLNYQFKNKYLLTLTGRADGSSRLAEGNKWAFFPAVSAGWILSEESFINSPHISLLKLRVGYGEVGNTSIAPYQTLGGLSRTTYAFGSDQAFGFGQTLIPNPDLRWEISKTLNLGMDFGLLQDRITGSLEIYDTKTEDLLLRRFIPITSGYNSILQNIGSTRNRGWELGINSKVINSTSKGFKWNINFNVFSNREEIVSLFTEKENDVGNQWFIGQPINVFYSFKQVGIRQSPGTGYVAGDIEIADINGRNAAGELTNVGDGKINSDDRMVLGSTVPDWTGGLTNRISYKGIDLSVFVYARQGQLLRSDYHNLGANNWQGRYNSLNLDYWTPTNPNNNYPRPYSSKAPLYADAVSYFDGSFVKIKNISLGYNLGSKTVKQFGMSSLRMYATVNNAFTFSKFDVVDPEVAGGRVGISNPLTSSSVVVGANIKF